MIKSLLKKIFKHPDVILTTPSGAPYLRRWWIISPNSYWGFNIYVHEFLNSDEDRALHDHPWWNISFILTGKYLEHMPRDHKKWVEKGDRVEIIKERGPFCPVYRPPESIHRVELFPGEESVWTLFITGPKVREWGFWCPFGFKHNRKFLDPTGTKKGPGCGD